MGSLNAMGMADAVNDGMVGLRQAVSWHLTSNHYPPHPAFMVDVAMAALADPEGEVTLPEGVEYRDGRTVLDAWEVIDSLHLDAFLVDDDFYDEADYDDDDGDDDE